MDINHLDGNAVHAPEPSAIIQPKASQSTSEPSDLESSSPEDDTFQMIRAILKQRPINVAVVVAFEALIDNSYSPLWPEICQLMVERIEHIAQTSTISEAFKIVIGISTSSFPLLDNQFRITVCRWMLERVMQMPQADFFRMGNVKTILLHCLCADDVRNGFRDKILQWMRQMNPEELTVIEMAITQQSELITMLAQCRNELSAIDVQRRSEIERQNPSGLHALPEPEPEPELDI